MKKNTNQVTITLEQQIDILQDRILELENENHMLRTKETRKWDFECDEQEFWKCWGFTQAQFEELKNIVDFWYFKNRGRDIVILEKIESAPVPLREKMCMMTLFTELSRMDDPVEPDPKNPPKEA